MEAPRAPQSPTTQGYVGATTGCPGTWIAVHVEERKGGRIRPHCLYTPSCLSNTVSWSRVSEVEESNNGKDHANYPMQVANGLVCVERIFEVKSLHPQSVEQHCH